MHVWSHVVFVPLVLMGCGRIGYDPAGQGADASGSGADAMFFGEAGVWTVAGGGEAGFEDGVGAEARFRNPVNVRVGPDGNVYVADHGNDAIRVMTPEGVVTTLAGPHPALEDPFGIALSPDGDLYVSTDHGRILQVDRDTGAVTVLVDGFTRIRAVAALPDGRLVFTETPQHVIRLLDPGTGETTVLAGASGQAGHLDATGAAARFDFVTDLVLLPDQAMIVSDLRNHVLRHIDPDSAVTTFAGSERGHVDGDRASAEFSGPQGLALGPDGSLLIADRFNLVIRRIDPGGQVSTIAGNGTQGSQDAADPLEASFHALEGIDVSPDGRLLYIADGDSLEGGPYHRVRRLTLE